MKKRNDRKFSVVDMYALSSRLVVKPSVVKSHHASLRGSPTLKSSTLPRLSALGRCRTRITIARWLVVPTTSQAAGRSVTRWLVIPAIVRVANGSVAKGLARVPITGRAAMWAICAGLVPATRCCDGGGGVAAGCVCSVCSRCRLCFGNVVRGVDCGLARRRDGSSR